MQPGYAIQRGTDVAHCPGAVLLNFYAGNKSGRIPGTSRPRSYILNEAKWRDFSVSRLRMDECTGASRRKADMPVQLRICGGKGRNQI